MAEGSRLRDLDEITASVGDDLVEVSQLQNDNEYLSKKITRENLRTDILAGHTHPVSDIVDFDAEVENNTEVSANTTHRSLTNNPHDTSIANLDSGTLLELNDNISDAELSQIPAGMVSPFAIDIAPSGWLECDGSAVNRTIYARLFSAIGEIYGDGDTVTTFNLPDYRGNYLKGWDNGSGNDPYAYLRTDRGDGVMGDNVGTKEELNADVVSGSSSSALWAGDTTMKNVFVMYCIKT